MKNTIEKYREKFLNEYGLKFQKDYFSDQENKELNEIIKTGDQAEVDKILEEYSYDYDTVKEKYVFYKKVPSDYSKDDIDQFIQLKTLEYIRHSNSSITTIKIILIFWCILTIIGILLSLMSFFAMLRI